MEKDSPKNTILDCPSESEELRALVADNRIPPAERRELLKRLESHCKQIEVWRKRASEAETQVQNLDRQIVILKRTVAELRSK